MLVPVHGPNKEVLLHMLMCSEIMHISFDQECLVIWSPLVVKL